MDTVQIFEALKIQTAASIRYDLDRFGTAEDQALIDGLLDLAISRGLSCDEAYVFRFETYTQSLDDRIFIYPLIKRENEYYTILSRDDYLMASILQELAYCLFELRSTSQLTSEETWINSHTDVDRILQHLESSLNTHELPDNLREIIFNVLPPGGTSIQFRIEVEEAIELDKPSDSYANLEELVKAGEEANGLLQKLFPGEH